MIPPALVLFAIQALGDNAALVSNDARIRSLLGGA
jgi:hypothetical protein